MLIPSPPFNVLFPETEIHSAVSKLCFWKHELIIWNLSILKDQRKDRIITQYRVWYDPFTRYNYYLQLFKAVILVLTHSSSFRPALFQLLHEFWMPIEKIIRHIIKYKAVLISDTWVTFCTQVYNKTKR